MNISAGLERQSHGPFRLPPRARAARNTATRISCPTPRELRRNEFSCARLAFFPIPRSRPLRRMKRGQEFPGRSCGACALATVRSYLWRGREDGVCLMKKFSAWIGKRFCRINHGTRGYIQEHSVFESRYCLCEKCR